MADLAVELDQENDGPNGRGKAAAGPKLRKGAKPQRKQRAVKLQPAELDGFDPKERKELLTMAGKEISAALGAGILRQILKASGKTMRQVARETGFDVSLLSNIANGKRKSGPELWTLIALADAEGFDLTFDLERR